MSGKRSIDRSSPIEHGRCMQSHVLYVLIKSGRILLVALLVCHDLIHQASVTFKIKIPNNIYVKLNIYARLPNPARTSTMSCYCTFIIS